MQKLKLTLIICAVTLFVLACNNATDSNQTAGVGATPAAPAAPVTAPTTAKPAGTDELAAAGTTYGQVCVRCHKESGEGGLFEMDNEKLKVPSLREGKAVKDTDQRLAKQIADGGDGMPAFKKRLTSEQIAGLVRFIRVSLQGKKEQ